MLGTSGTQVYGYGYNTVSDERDKADIRETELGLNFILQIKPIQYHYNYRVDYKQVDIDPTTKEKRVTVLKNDGSKKRKRFHQGVSAQQVKSVMDKLKVDFAGYQDHKIVGGEDQLTIGYQQFIGPLIKSVQELNAQHVALIEKSGGSREIIERARS